MRPNAQTGQRKRALAAWMAPKSEQQAPRARPVSIPNEPGCKLNLHSPRLTCGHINHFISPSNCRAKRISPATAKRFLKILQHFCDFLNLDYYFPCAAPAEDAVLTTFTHKTQQLIWWTPLSVVVVRTQECYRS